MPAHEAVSVGLILSAGALLRMYNRSGWFGADQMIPVLMMDVSLTPDERRGLGDEKNNEKIKNCRVEFVRRLLSSIGCDAASGRNVRSHVNGLIHWREMFIMAHTVWCMLCKAHLEQRHEPVVMAMVSIAVQAKCSQSYAY